MEDLVDKHYVAKALGLTAKAVSNYGSTNPDRLPPNRVKIKRRWYWPKTDVDRFAEQPKPEKPKKPAKSADDMTLQSEDRHQIQYRPMRVLTAQEIVDAGYELSPERYHELGF